MALVQFSWLLVLCDNVLWLFWYLFSSLQVSKERSAVVPVFRPDAAVSDGHQSVPLLPFSPSPPLIPPPVLPLGFCHPPAYGHSEWEASAVCMSWLLTRRCWHDGNEWWRTDPCGKCPCRGLQIWFPIVHVYWNLMDLLKWPLGGMKVILEQNWDFIRSVVPYWINAVLEWPPLDLVQLLLCWFSWLLIESFYDGLSHFQVDCYIFLDFMYI